MTDKSCDIGLVGLGVMKLSASILSVDGGVHEGTIDRLVEAGVDVFVAGSAIFGIGDYRESIRQLRARMRKEE